MRGIAVTTAVILGGGAIAFASAVLTFFGLGDTCLISNFVGGCFLSIQELFVLVPLLFLGGKIVQWYSLWLSN